MSQDTRILKAQAMNLAIQVAIANNKSEDNKYVLSQTARFITLLEAVQTGTKEALETALNES